MKPSPLQPLRKQHIKNSKENNVRVMDFTHCFCSHKKKSAPVGNTPHSKRNSGIVKSLLTWTNKEILL